MPLAIALSLIAYEILYVFVHLAVYGVLVAAFGIGGTWLKVIFILLAFSFTAATLLSFRFQGRFITWFYIFSAYWFGLINFLFMGAVTWFIIENIFNHYNVWVSPALIGAITFGAAFLIHLYGTWNAERAGITRISVSLPNLPAAWRGRKIVFVSDVHLGNVHRVKFAAKVVRKISALKPEAVFIGGDMFDGGACDPDALVAPFRDLHAPKGVYFISGNHEFYVRNFETAFEAIRRTGIRILNNEKIDIDGVEIVGVDYLAVHKKEDFAATLAKIGIDRSKTNILLKHEPDNLPVAESAGITMGFFGHTHQGQIFPLSIITRQMYNGFDYGLKQHGTMKVYTSSGVGTWGPPLRLGTKSEIVLVEFL
jgi:predicted MPP superfamily phosphohydrolase